MSDDEEHLPKLSIPPDHPIAVEIFDLDCARWLINDKLNDAIRTNDPEQHRLREAFEVCDAGIRELDQKYRDEVGAPAHQRVGLTYDGIYPVVKGRYARPTQH